MENGTYRARALGAALGEAGTGKEQVGIEFEFLDHPGVRLTYYGYFTDKATEITIKALRTAGWRGDDLSDLTSIGGPDAPEVSLVVENEEYQGQRYSKIKWVNSAGGLAMKTQLSPDKAKAFAARMRGAVLAFDRGAGARPAAAPSASRSSGRPPEPPPHDDSDMPPF